MEPNRRLHCAPDDTLFIAARIPKDVRELLTSTPLFLGGGYIRAIIAGEKPNDLDIFGPDKDTLTACAYQLALARGGKIHRTDNALTVLAPPRLPVQFITRWLFSDPAQLMASFDFTIAQAVIYYVRAHDIPGNDGNPVHISSRWELLTAPRFYQDLAARRLVYNAPERAEDAGGSLLRVRKFLAGGYNIQVSGLAAVMARCCMGVEQVKGCGISEGQLAFVLNGLLREVDPLTVIDGFDVVEEHHA